jgi:CspA family cold shock protein
VFVHFSAVVGSGYRDLEDNQRVEFEVTQGQRGPAAVDVRAI